MTVILTLMIMGIVTCVLALCVGVLIDRYQRSVVASARTSSAQAVTQVASTVGSYTHDMNEVMTLLASTLEDGTTDRADFFGTFLRMRPDVIAVSTYSADGLLQNCWALDRTPKANIVKNLSFDQNRAAGKTGYVSSPHVETIFDSYYPWVVTIGQRISTDGEEWAALDISFTAISSYISNVGIGQHGYCFVMDDAGDIVYHPQQQLLYSGLKNEDTAVLATMQDGTYVQDNVIYSVRSVEDSAWRVVGVSYVDELITGNVAGMVRVALNIALAALLCTFLVSLVSSRVFSRPLRSLASAMGSFEQQGSGFSYGPSDRGSREVRELSASFGHMVVRIQQLMNTVREEEVNLRKTELKALQAQINPHFLYNTLDSIAWMCEQGRNDDAVQMVHALATLFRISISRGSELIPISREIEHAKSYLRIQQCRYKNQFVYRFDVDPSCEEYLCNKITLQPIIENAICHGLDLLVDEGRIDVTVRADGEDIVFVVEDNGVGMPQEQADAMLSREPSDRTGIGIKNVNDRLRIYFGEKYGLHITSEPDVGTRVEIRMPKVREGEYETK